MEIHLAIIMECTALFGCCNWLLFIFHQMNIGIFTIFCHNLGDAYKQPLSSFQHLNKSFLHIELNHFPLSIPKILTPINLH